MAPQTKRLLVVISIILVLFLILIYYFSSNMNWLYRQEINELEQTSELIKSVRLTTSNKPNSLTIFVRLKEGVIEDYSEVYEMGFLLTEKIDTLFPMDIVGAASEYIERVHLLIRKEYKIPLINCHREDNYPNTEIYWSISQCTEVNGKQEVVDMFYYRAFSDGYPTSND